MVQLVTPPLQAELPREFLACLTPRLRELYSQLPSALALRISDLVSEALPFGIHPDRVLKFAYLDATAERLAQGNAIQKSIRDARDWNWRGPFTGGKRAMETMERRRDATAAAEGRGNKSRLLSRLF
jgi:hypothetical protein